jgi:hypothetical protein
MSQLGAEWAEWAEWAPRVAPGARAGPAGMEA